MDELWMGKYEMRANYDSYQPEVLIAGVWVSLELITEEKAQWGDVKAIEAIREKYGDEVADELLNSTEECKHKYVFDGIEDGMRRYKCHECKDTYIDERAN